LCLDKQGYLSCVLIVVAVADLPRSRFGENGAGDDAVGWWLWAVDETSSPVSLKETSARVHPTHAVRSVIWSESRPGTRNRTNSPFSPKFQASNDDLNEPKVLVEHGWVGNAPGSLLRCHRSRLTAVS